MNKILRIIVIVFAIWGLITVEVNIESARFLITMSGIVLVMATQDENAKKIIDETNKTK